MNKISIKFTVEYHINNHWVFVPPTAIIEINNYKIDRNSKQEILVVFKNRYDRLLTGLHELKRNDFKMFGIIANEYI